MLPGDGQGSLGESHSLVVHELWVLVVGGSNPFSPTQKRLRARHAFTVTCVVSFFRIRETSCSITACCRVYFLLPWRRWLRVSFVQAESFVPKILQLRPLRRRVEELRRGWALNALADRGGALVAAKTNGTVDRARPAHARGRSVVRAESVHACAAVLRVRRGVDLAAVCLDVVAVGKRYDARRDLAGARCARCVGVRVAARDAATAIAGRFLVCLATV